MIILPLKIWKPYNEHVMSTGQPAAFEPTRVALASPLNRHSSIPKYASCIQSDKTFSALYNAYAYKWIGSGFVNPGSAADNAFKAVRLAIASCYEDAPVFNLVIMPGSHVTPGMQAAATSLRDSPLLHPCSCMHVFSACMLTACCAKNGTFPQLSLQMLIAI